MEIQYSCSYLTMLTVANNIYTSYDIVKPKLNKRLEYAAVG